jgi:peptidoglycan/xylan/chitin deacetylase (PgdA/CDA1 family)
MKLTILMYHKVDELDDGVRHPGNYVSPTRFVQQLDALLEWGYHTIDFGQWLDYRGTDGSSELLDKPLVVTFDDGYTCFDTNAWPALRARGMGATVFLVAGQIGGTNAWDTGEVELPLLDARRILALQSEGVHFGSHSVMHRPLVHIPVDDARDELTRSRQQLGELLGRDVDVFAYPFSNQNGVVRELAREAGYRCAVRGKGRMNSRHTDPYGLRRIKVEPTTTIESLERTLARERHRWFF